MPKKMVYIDAFAGCGGISSGFSAAGLSGIFAIEKNIDAFKTLKHNLSEHYNWPTWLPFDAIDIIKLLKKHDKNLKKLRGKIDLIAGGPPCQGYSTAGTRQHEDGRNKLINHYIKLVDVVQPNFLFFENVKGFSYRFSAGKIKSGLEKLEKRLVKIGYSVDWRVVSMDLYGVPQKRQRIILIGKKNGNASDFFDLCDNQIDSFLKQKNMEKTTSLDKAISDLRISHGIRQCPDSSNFTSGVYGKAMGQYQKIMRGNTVSKTVPNSHRFTKHRTDSEKSMKSILKSKSAIRNKKISAELKNKLSIKKRSITPLSKNEPCPVLTSHPDDYIHYSEPRILTVRECARIQSFPDTFEFCGKYTTGGKLRKKDVPRYTQVANAVPPLFAEFSGRIFRQMWDKNK